MGELSLFALQFALYRNLGWRGWEHMLQALSFGSSSAWQITQRTVQFTTSLPSCLPSHNYTAWAAFFFFLLRKVLCEAVLFLWILPLLAFFSSVYVGGKKCTFSLGQSKVGASIIATPRIMHNSFFFFFPQGKYLIALILFCSYPRENKKKMVVPASSFNYFFPYSICFCIPCITHLMLTLSLQASALLRDFTS